MHRRMQDPPLSPSIFCSSWHKKWRRNSKNASKLLLLKNFMCGSEKYFKMRHRKQKYVASQNILTPHTQNLVSASQFGNFHPSGTGWNWPPQLHCSHWLTDPFCQLGKPTRILLAGVFSSASLNYSVPCSRSHII